MVNRPYLDAILPPVSAEDEATVDALLAKAREGVGKRPINRRPDLDAIRAEHCNPNLVDAGARKAVRELLAYIDELERDILNERATFESCNRARRHCEDECASLRARIRELEAKKP